MTDQRCLYALLNADREDHELLIKECVSPVTRKIRDDPNLDSLFFARYNVPEWQLRFRILGRPAWIDGPVRDLLDETLHGLRDRGLAPSWEYATYDRELERYGGPEGMALAETVFFHDTCLCLDLLEAEGRGGAHRSRREISLLYADRFLDLMEFTRDQRLAFYAHGYRWALDTDTWREEELRALDARYRELRPALHELLHGSLRDDPVAAWGGDIPAAAAARAFTGLGEVTGRLREAHAAGRVQQEIVYLVWSYTHMQCNRMGIDPSGEAVLRYFVHRLLLDGPPA
jgi:thiopeptide-type bacteriocin biosynthesis protein